MRSTRAAYHRAVRHIKKNQEDIINEKFAHALMDNNNRDFWKEVKHIRSNHSTSVNFVDGMCDSCDIAGIFATKYQDLYSCVSYRSSDMSHVRRDTIDSVAGAGFNKHCLFSKEDVVIAIGSQRRWQRGSVDRSFSPCLS